MGWIMGEGISRMDTLAAQLPERFNEDGPVKLDGVQSEWSLAKASILGLELMAGLLLHD
jgi:hypothetical protein